MKEREPRYVRATGVILRRVAGEPLLVRVAGRSPLPASRGADLLVLNEAGERIWEWLGEPRTGSELAQNLIVEFDVSHDTAYADVLEFLGSMQEFGAVAPVQELPST